MAPNEIPRSSERRPLDILVEGRIRSRPMCVELIDVSEGGCKIKGKLGFVTEGDSITLKLGEIRAPFGTVVWVEDRYAGVSFEGRMHEAVLDHLQQELAAKRAEKEQRR